MEFEKKSIIFSEIYCNILNNPEVDLKSIEFEYCNNLVNKL